jgi:copper oxidase (laccase) domain-containing protein
LARWFSDGEREGRWQFDGWQAAADQLAAAGVPAGQIHGAGLCTAAYPSLFCSYRRDATGAGRMAAAIRCCAKW